jgi:2-C-methyl-D-erythritol 4-phosphate cytidylyltransferase
VDDGSRSQQPQRPSLALVVAAAGHGTRLGLGMPKQYAPLLGIPMLQRTLSALAACDWVDSLVVVVNEMDVEYCEEEIRLEHIPKVERVVAGGAKRPLSVRNGLEALAEIGTWDLVGIHDGARPLVGCAEIIRVVEALVDDPELSGAVLGVPSIDTVKIVDESGLITGTPHRRSLWQAQTPQIFRWQALFDAYDQSDDALTAATDDSSLVEALAGRVRIVEGSPENFKITNQVDLRHAEQILADRRQ